MRFSEVVQIDKEDDFGRWLLSYTPRPNDAVVFRLRISVGGRWDWHIFQVEVQTHDEKATMLGTFDIAPVEVHSDIQAELLAIRVQTIEEARDLRALELERLDAMTVGLWPGIQKGNAANVVQEFAYLSAARNYWVWTRRPPRRRKSPARCPSVLRSA